MKRLTPVLAVIALLLLNACATPMQAEDYSERFTTTWQASDRFTVSYRDNPDSSDKMATELSLLRAAEIALQHGFHYFVVVSAEDLDEREPVSVPKARGTTRANPDYHLASPAATNTIVCFRDRPAGFAYVALFVKASLRASYGLDRASAPI